MRKPVRIRGLVVGDQHLIGASLTPAPRAGAPGREPATRTRPGLELAPEQLDPLAHPDQPVPAGCLRVARRSRAVVGDLELERVRS